MKSNFWKAQKVICAVLGSLVVVAALAPAASAGRQPRNPAGAVSRPAVADVSGTTAAAEQSPWWVEWLAAVDDNGNLIEDEAEAIATHAMANNKPNELVPVIVSFNLRPTQVGSFLRKTIEARNLYTFRTQPMVALSVPARNLESLATVPGVVAVASDELVHPTLDVSTSAVQSRRGPEGKGFYNGLTAEDLGYSGENMVVAVIDTGVNDHHEAFAGKLIAGTNVNAPGFPDDGCPNPLDAGIPPHGTHVASIALGAWPLGDLSGVAPGAKLVDVRVSPGVRHDPPNADPTYATGAAPNSSILKGFEFVKLYNDRLAAGNPLCSPNDDHIDVATLSMGHKTSSESGGTAEPFIDALVESGVAVTIAAGNCGPGTPNSTGDCTADEFRIGTYAASAGAITVAAFDDDETVARGNDVIAHFSSRGPLGPVNSSVLSDRRRKPDVAAPGVDITAAGPVPLTSLPLSGTSHAAPHVAGIAALLLEAGEDARAETGGVNLMASTGNGYIDDTYAPGVYPVRDALIHGAEYKQEGAKARWTGPNSRGVMWNNAWGYGQVNAFGALCWAWANVLAPGGATIPPKVSETCALPEPKSPAFPPSGPVPPEVDVAGGSLNKSPTRVAPTPPPGATGPRTTYYLHSVSGDNTQDQTIEDGATFDKVEPTDEGQTYAVARDLRGQNGGVIEIVDPTWRGEMEEPTRSLSVDFWADAAPDSSLGEINYTVRVLPEGAARYIELLPSISRKVSGSGPFHVKHTFTSMDLTDASGDEVPLNLPAGALTFTIRGYFWVNDAVTEIRFDSSDYPSSFTVDGKPPLGTEVSFTPESAQAGQYTDDATLSARLTDETGEPVVDAPLVFELVGANASHELGVTTDASGVATVAQPLTGDVGDHLVSVRFAGLDGAYEPAADVMSFFVSKEDSTSSLAVSEVSGNGLGAKRTLTVTLSDADSSNGVADRAITFFSDGELMGTARTDANGVATFVTPHNFANGHRVYEGRFDGDDYFLGSTDTYSKEASGDDSPSQQPI